MRIVRNIRVLTASFHLGIKITLLFPQPVNLVAQLELFFFCPLLHVCDLNLQFQLLPQLVADILHCRAATAS